MRNNLTKLSSAALLLYLFVIFTQVVTGYYLALGLEAPPGFTVLYPLGLLWAIGGWLRADSRGRRVRWVFDMGLFLYIAWPFYMPYYLLKTRGAKGLLLLLGFGGAYVGGLLAGVALYVIRAA